MTKLRPAAQTLFSAFAALSMLLVAAASPRPVAAGPTAIPQGPVPTGDLKPVELSYLAIDATVVPTAGGMALRVVSRARLRNNDKRAAYQREVTFPGPAVTNVRVGTQNGGLAPAAAAGPWLLSLRADGDAVIEGTQEVATSGPLADLQFDWSALKPWGATLAAVRLTLHFPDGVDSDQLLAVDPAPTARDTTQLTWSYEKFQPAGTIHLFFVAPGYWQPLHKARQAAASAQAGAAEFLALAAALRPLATFEGMPEGVATILQAEALAALERAVVAAPKDPRTHQELAGYLQAQARGDPAILARAVAEFKAACDLAPADAEAKKRLLAAVDDLIAACRRANDTQGLLQALDVVQAVDPANSPQRAAAYADLAVSQLQAGQEAEAQATIAAGFGQAALDQYALARPHFRSVTGEVEMQSGRRVLRFGLVPAPGAEQAAEADMARLADALGRMGGQATHTAAGGTLQLEATIPFDDASRLVQAGRALVGSLPADEDPAIVLVAAVAAPARLEFGTSQGLRADRLTYAESADLAPAQAALERRLEQIRYARAEAQAPIDNPVETARRRWALALLDRYEAGWQALARGSRVTYHVLPPGNYIVPQWALAWGETREIGWSTTLPHPERLWPFAAAGAVVLVAVALGAALARRRRET